MYIIIRETIEGRPEIVDRVMIGKTNPAIVRSNVTRIIRGLREQDPDSTYRYETSGAAK